MGNYCKHKILDILQNTLPYWFLPCFCFLPKCECLAQLMPAILCVKGESLSNAPPFLPHHSLPK